MKYVGQTVASLKARLNTHFSEYSRCARLKSAIKKYGKDNFKIEEILVIKHDSKEKIRELLNIEEKKLIKQLDCIHPKGYNLTDGGDNPIRTKEVSEKIAMKHWKPVKCIETGQTWNSVKECASFFEVKPKQISRILTKQRKRLKWKFTLVYL